MHRYYNGDIFRRENRTSRYSAKGFCKKCVLHEKIKKIVLGTK